MKGYDRKECVLYYVPKGETRESILESGKPILMWKTGDTIPRRYARHLALGILLVNGECDLSGPMEYYVLCLDKRNQYLRTGGFEWKPQLFENPRQYKEIWLYNIAEGWPPNCIRRVYAPVHFYIGK